MSTHVPAFNPATLPPGAKFAIVAARFNEHIVDELLAGCIRRFGQMGVDEDRLIVHRVPGAFELPVAAKLLAKTNHYAAIVCLGAVVRGRFGPAPASDIAFRIMASSLPGGGRSSIDLSRPN